MNHEDLLENYRIGPLELEREVVGIAGDLADYRPFETAWTIREHVVHVADADINNFIRWKSIIAQPRSRTFAIDEERWTKNTRYTKASMEKHIAVLKLLREIGYDYLIEIDEGEWNNEYFLRGDSDKVTLEKCITIYTNHIPVHIEYIKRNKKLWTERPERNRES
jgi:hypothetical protein